LYRVSDRRDRHALVDPLIAAIGIDRSKRFLDEPRRAGRQRRVHQVCRCDAADAVVLGPGAGEERAEARRQMGGEIDDGIMPGHCLADRIGGEQIDLDRARPGARELGARLRPARDRGHAVARADQQRHGPPAEHPGRPGEENPHTPAPGQGGTCRFNSQGGRRVQGARFRDLLGVEPAECPITPGSDNSGSRG
jgi:hypothetical protein